MRIPLPAHGAHDLDRQRRDAVGQDAHAVGLVLEVKDLEAGDRDHAGLDVVLLLELLDGVDADAHLGTSRHKRDVGGLVLVEDVPTLDGLLDGRALELGKVLAGESHDAGGVLGRQGDVVSSAGLVAISRAPDHVVGEGAVVGERLDRLVSGAILAEADRVVGRHPEDADARERREARGTGSVRHEVEESTTVGHNGAVGSQTVHDGTHGVLADAVANVATGVVTKLGRRGLEVDGVLPPGQVRASQIGGTTDELGNGLVDLVEDNLGQLAGGNGGVGGGVDGEGLLPALGEIASLAADEVVVLSLVLLAVLGEEVVPLGLELGATGRGLVAQLVDVLGNGEALLGVEAELLLELLDVVGLEGRAVDVVGTLLLGAETNDGRELDERGLGLLLLTLLDGGLDAVEVVLAVTDGQDLPAVGLVALENVLGEGHLGAAVNGDLVVVPDGNEVAELEVARQGGSLARDTLHQAAVAEEAVCVVVDQVEAGLVEDGGGVGLGHGETHGVADTLAEGTGGHLDAGGIMGLGMPGSDAVDGLGGC